MKVVNNFMTFYSKDLKEKIIYLDFYFLLDFFFFTFIKKNSLSNLFDFFFLKLLKWIQE